LLTKKELKEYMKQGEEYPLDKNGKPIKIKGGNKYGNIQYTRNNSRVSR